MRFGSIFLNELRGGSKKIVVISLAYIQQFLLFGNVFA